MLHIKPLKKGLMFVFAVQQFPIKPQEKVSQNLKLSERWFGGSGSRCEPQGSKECECHKVPLHSEEC